MLELNKIEDKLFKNVYEGINGRKKVWCCLDNNCVRYIIWINKKEVAKHEFPNEKKDLCFNNATKALNIKKNLNKRRGIL